VFGDAKVTTALLESAGNCFADRNCRRGRGRRCVADMQAAGRLREQKIMDHLAPASHCLRADSRTVRQKVVNRQVRTVSPAFFQVSALRERVAQFFRHVSTVAERQFPEAAVGQQLPCVPRVGGQLGISLPGEAQDRVRAYGDAAVDHAGEVDAEERKRRVGSRVNEMLYNPVP
jgi:hypothetical protein